MDPLRRLLVVVLPAATLAFAIVARAAAPSAAAASGDVSRHARSVPLAATLAEGGAGFARRLADDLLGGSTADRLRLVASAAGLAPASPTRALRGGDDVRLDGLPADLAGSVARLHAAVSEAERLRHEALDGVTPDELRRLVAAAASDAGLTVRAGSAAAGVQASPVTGAAAVLGDRVDVARLVTASRVVVEAVEAEVPALRAMAARRAAGDAALAPATVDMCPTLAVDLSGDTAHDADCRLIVDLVGNDRYTAGAGAAGDLGVSVVVDVTGDDVYEARAEADVLVAQGAGFGGVGVLFDVAGDDRYTAEDVRNIPDLTPEEPVTVVAQGAAAVGAGVLVDGGGSDTFDVVAGTRGDLAQVVAQGGGLLGVGLLVHGPGDASYRAEATTGVLKTFESANITEFRIGSAAVVAQGGGASGAGTLVDVAGDTTYAARATGASGTAIGHGGGQAAGVGIAVDGAGEDGYVLEGIGDLELDITRVVDCPSGFVCGFNQNTDARSGASTAIGQGGAIAGAGVSVDLGTEDNERTISATSEVRSGAAVELGSGNGGDFRAVAVASNGDAMAMGQGAAEIGAGVVVSGLGSDRNEVVARSRAVAEARASGGTRNVAEAEARGGDSLALAHGYAVTGAGVSADAGGDDVYAIDQDASAQATQNGAAGTTSVGTVRTFGRGFGTNGAGVSADAGGDDAYGAMPGGEGDGGGDDRCWTNGPSGPTSIGSGIDVDGGADGSCVPPPL